jgi:hypothetical protein
MSVNLQIFMIAKDEKSNTHIIEELNERNPTRCHNDLIVPIVVKMVEDLLKKNNEIRNKYKC